MYANIFIPTLAGSQVGNKTFCNMGAISGAVLTHTEAGVYVIGEFY